MALSAAWLKQGTTYLIFCVKPGLCTDDRSTIRSHVCGRQKRRPVICARVIEAPSGHVCTDDRSTGRQQARARKGLPRLLAALFLQEVQYRYDE